MIKFITSGTTVAPIELNPKLVTDQLKPMIYICSYQQDRGLFLSMYKDRFDIPETLFGSVNRRAQKIIDTFNSRDSSTGVLSTGDKGAGKTLLTQTVANRLLDQGLPVILVNAPYRGDAFNLFIERCGECVLLFDEFSKVYAKTNDENPQNDLLTFFDGNSSSKRLILVTENSTRDINEFMLARPGRMYYHFKYNKLEAEVVKEYCAANEVPTEKVDELLEIHATMSSFSFDILKTIVEEYHRYPETELQELINDLNIGYDDTKRVQMSVVKAVDKTTGKDLRVPLTRNIVEMPTRNSYGYLYYLDEEGDEDYYTFGVQSLVYEKGNRFVYETDNFMFIFEKLEETSNWSYKSHF